MANGKMKDTYDLETSLKGIGSIKITANDQLYTTTYLISILLEIVSAAVRRASKTEYYNFKNSFLLSSVYRNL